MNQRLKNPGDRLPLFITIGIFVVMLACLPIVSMMDASHDEDRPTYQDMLRMENLQRLLVANKERPVATTVTGGESVDIGPDTFKSSPGVTVVVRVVDKDSFCVSASNDRGVEAKERCSK